MWIVNFDTLLAIIGMAAVTYILRSTGLLLVEVLPTQGRWARALHSLSGTVLLAIIAPAIVATGWIGLPATVLTIITTLITRNALAAMLVGVTVVSFGRMVGFG
jgi:uncharacterized membrane protein